MTVPVIAFFNNKGGVGKTSLVYHTAWMAANLGYRVLATDADPQGNLSAAFLDDDRLEQLWPKNQSPATIYGAIRPLREGTGDVGEPTVEEVGDGLALIPGDMALSAYEDDLSLSWPRCLETDLRAFRVISAFWRVMQKGAAKHSADFILLDVGPNLGSINRSALIASDYVVIPLAPDLFSLQGLQNLGPTLVDWRKSWKDRVSRKPSSDLELPDGRMKPIGYIVMQHSVRSDRPVKSYDKWIGRIPAYYRQYILEQSTGGVPLVADDANCVALLKHYRSLMPMAQESRKPIFALKPADGALGAHTYAVQDAYRDFSRLTEEILARAGIGRQRPSDTDRVQRADKE